MKIRLVWYNRLEKSSAVVVPLGMAYIASSLERHGHSPEVVDLTFEEQKRVPVGEAGCVYGFYSATTLISDVLRLIADVRKRDPEAVIILGGPHGTMLPGDVLKEGSVDIVVIGEGEETAVRLMNALERKEDLSTVPGIAYREGDQIRFTMPARPVEDLDSLPFPALERFPLDRYFGRRGIRELPMIAARGCPGNCIFCQPTVRKLFGSRLRYRSAANIVDEMEMLVKRHRVDMISFVDDTFGSNTGILLGVCDEIIRRRLDVLWRCQTRVGMKKDVLARMKESGCIGIAFGVESGSQDILNNLRKGITLEQVRETFRNCRAVGILTHAFLMVGSFGETQETVQRTIDLVREIRPFNINVSITTPYPGTDLHDWARQNGRLLVEKWEEYDHILTDTAGIRLDGMSHADVIAAKERVISEFERGLKGYKKRQLYDAAFNRRFIGRSVRMLLSDPSRAGRFLKLAYNVSTRSGFSVVQ